MKDEVPSESSLQHEKGLDDGNRFRPAERVFRHVAGSDDAVNDDVRTPVELTVADRNDARRKKRRSTHADEGKEKEERGQGRCPPAPEKSDRWTSRNQTPPVEVAFSHTSSSFGLKKGQELYRVTGVISSCRAGS